ncbi:MAG TPA: hypothetical protein PKC12_01435 [Thiobacillaceae bacterium]|nr:hypothetical protein [Thiobacillaceae bacterium]
MSILQSTSPEQTGRCAPPPRTAAEVGNVRPGRVRNRPKTGPEEKVKKPGEGTRKKPPARKTPPRGRYVDEYAHPPIPGARSMQA